MISYFILFTYFIFTILYYLFTIYMVDFQIEGELKIQELAQYYSLNASITYLPYPYQQDSHQKTLTSTESQLFQKPNSQNSQNINKSFSKIIKFKKKSSLQNHSNNSLNLKETKETDLNSNQNKIIRLKSTQSSQTLSQTKNEQQETITKLEENSICTNKRKLHLNTQHTNINPEINVNKSNKLFQSAIISMNKKIKK